MDNIPAVVINYRREIIPASTLDFEIGKIGLPHLISEFSLMMEFISCKYKIMPHTFPIDLFHAIYDKSLTPKQISDSLPIKKMIIYWGELWML